MVSIVGSAVLAMASIVGPGALAVAWIAGPAVLAVASIAAVAMLLTGVASLVAAARGAATLAAVVVADVEGCCPTLTGRAVGAATLDCGSVPEIVPATAEGPVGALRPLASACPPKRHRNTTPNGSTRRCRQAFRTRP